MTFKAAKAAKRANTPEQIVDRSEGATFYCADCRETYQRCRCKVYRSADTIKPQ